MNPQNKTCLSCKKNFNLCYDNSFLEYCDSCQNSQNLLGCISVKKGEYMIFNKKYSKEKIIEHMKKNR